MATTSALMVALVLHAAGAGAGDHLLAGANLFRDGRYADALVEFRVAGKLGAPDADRYSGAALVKLERYEEAVEAFGDGDAPGPDPLVDYYRGVACYGAKLFRCADTLLASVAGRGGPRIADQAAKLRVSAAAELARRAAPSEVDWYLGRCGELRNERRTTLAKAYCREARALAQRSGDSGRLSRADLVLAELSARKDAR